MKANPAIVQREAIEEEPLQERSDTVLKGLMMKSFGKGESTPRWLRFSS